MTPRVARRAPACDPGLALVGRIASVMFAHGQTTEGTRAVVAQLGEGLGRHLSFDARWGELTIREDGAADLRLPATPLGVDMGMVAAAGALADRVGTGRIGVAEGTAAIAALERSPPVGLLRFAVMAGLGAAALSIVFGAHEAATVASVGLSAGVGGLLRRAIARVGDNPFLQPFAAALLAGVLAAAAAALRLPVAPSLTALCPCMVLVPGPHFLNGLLDLARARIPLGAARLTFAGLIVVAISAGLLIGLSAETATLPVGGSAADVPLLADVAAAGLAVVAYGSFFNMPWLALPVPGVVGMLAHALRWELLARGAGVGTGAFLACALVGAVMTPAARRLRMPFGGLAFAAVVSMIPGIFMFRGASGALALTGGAPASQAAVGAVLGDAATALLILLAMAAGLLLPKMALERTAVGWSRPTP